MKIVFKCPTCGGPVGYDLIAVETHELRRYGVHRYECLQPCVTCSTPSPSHASFPLEPAEAPRSVSGQDFRPTGGLLQETALANV